MAFVVVYDACVLFPAPLRDLLIRLGVSGLVQAKWTDTILDECFRNLKKVRPELKDESLARTRNLMNAAVRDCLITGFEGRSTESSSQTPMIVTLSLRPYARARRSS
ncbi:MAG: hypothetical protein JNM17_12325 [Archangium sp.]|nr:hypothetical protein [Archangium sp.]